MSGRVGSSRGGYEGTVRGVEPERGAADGGGEEVPWRRGRGGGNEAGDEGFLPPGGAFRAGRRVPVSLVAGFGGAREEDEEDGEGVGWARRRVAGGASEEGIFRRG